MDTQIPMQHPRAVVDPNTMERTPNHLPEVTPPEGIVEMVCTEFIDDPAQMQAYAIFAGRIDAFLDADGVQGWAALDVPSFLKRCARTPSEAATLCCMLATVLPWMVRAGDLTRPQATQKCVAMLEVCTHDAEALGCIGRAKDEVQWQAAAGQRH